jgi:hypothetical protein
MIRPFQGYVSIEDYDLFKRYVEQVDMAVANACSFDLEDLLDEAEEDMTNGCLSYDTVYDLIDLVNLEYVNEDNDRLRDTHKAVEAVFFDLPEPGYTPY